LTVPPEVRRLIDLTKKARLDTTGDYLGVTLCQLDCYAEAHRIYAEQGQAMPIEIEAELLGIDE